jgi:hypothetical protein
MPLHLLRAEQADIPSLVALYFATFSSPLVLRIKPNLPSVRAWYTQSLEIDFNKPHVHVYKVVDRRTDEASMQVVDEIIAFAKWTEPHGELDEEVEEEEGKKDKSGECRWPIDGDPALFEEAAGKAAAKRREIMGDELHWCKWFLLS